MKLTGWIIFAFFAIVVGIYPALYLLLDMSGGLFASKPAALLADKIWLGAFYAHIMLGGISLLAGFTQFSKRIRRKNVGVHRTLGKIYLVAVMISGVAALYIAFFATGGIIPVLGFLGLAIGWLFTSVQAYRYAKAGDFDQHQYYMIRSYALCWAAVTLRIWLPLFQFGFAMDFIFAYRIIAWLCWVPNLIVAEMIVRSMKTKHLRPATI